jgi:hypothetical protein
MKIDPIVEQVREIRHRIELETHHDPELFYQHLRKLQEAFPERVVNPLPKKLPTEPTSLKRTT